MEPEPGGTISFRLHAMAVRLISLSAKLVAGRSLSVATGRSTVVPCRARASGITVSPAIITSERSTTKSMIVYVYYDE